MGGLFSICDSPGLAEKDNDPTEDEGVLTNSHDDISQSKGLAPSAPPLSSDGKSPVVKSIVDMARDGDLNGVKSEIAQGKNIDTQNNDGWTALMMASSKGSKEIAKLLNKGDLNIRNKEGNTAVMIASSKGHKDIVRSLADKNADLNIQNDVGLTALMFACDKMQMDVVKCLVEKCADLNIKDKDGWTALMFACNKGHSDIAKYLSERRANLNIKNQHGFTALMISSSGGYKEIVKNLLNKGAVVNYQAKAGWTALMMASEKGHKDIVKLLVTNDAPVNARNSKKSTALMIAAEKGHKDVALYLTRKGADLHIKNTLGKTALDYAEEYRFQDELLASSPSSAPSTPSTIIPPLPDGIKYHAFLTHNWSDNEDGHNNHDLVFRINDKLKSFGLITWFDGERMEGEMRKAMTDGIDNSAVVVVFITKTYIEKVNQGDKKDCCAYEFEYALQQKGSFKMIPVVMENRCTVSTNWRGVVGASLSGQLYLDMTNHTNPAQFNSRCDELKNEIIRRFNIKSNNP